MKEKYLLLDTSAIFSGKSIDIENFIIITTNSVLDEIKPGGKDYRNLQYLIAKGLKIFNPSIDSLKKIKSISKKTGDLTRLSKTDIDILALAYDMKYNSNINITILTDDYSIQNLSNFLKISFINISQSGITKRFKWSYKCIGCGKKFKIKLNECPICGSSLKNYLSKSKKLLDLSDSK